MCHYLDVRQCLSFFYKKSYGDYVLVDTDNIDNHYTDAMLTYKWLNLEEKLILFRLKNLVKSLYI